MQLLPSSLHHLHQLFQFILQGDRIRGVVLTHTLGKHEHEQHMGHTAQ